MKKTGGSSFQEQKIRSHQLHSIAVLFSGIKAIQKVIVLLIVVWTLFIAAFIGFNIYNFRQLIYEIGLAEARAAFQKDTAYRFWAASQGGVYAFADKVEPNPYLDHIENRDIVTTTGKKLTLVNPAYMTRMVHELSLKTYGLRGHITSLNSLRPENAPDDWERSALTILERDNKKEIFEKTTIGEKKYLRYMAPFVTDSTCLKCHGFQGYKIGDIRGGISVSIPLDSPEMSRMSNQANTFSTIFVIIWLFGLAGIAGGGKVIRKKYLEKEIADKQILAALEDKDILIRELYHRTKNNMQVICSLMQLQRSRIPDKSTKNIFKELENKIQSMALVQKKLYQSKNLSAINFRDYIIELSNLLITGFGIDKTKIRVNCNELENISILIDYATPCGLIINELIVNSIKHAFPGTGEGEITIKLKKDKYGFITFTVADNGIGIEEGFDLINDSGMGLTTVYSIAQNQLKGDIMLQNNGGLSISVRFKDNTYQKRI